jgi:hypothetical protein
MGNEPVSSAGTHFRQLTVLQTAQICEKRADAQAGTLRTEYDDNFAKGYRIRPAPGHRPRGNPEATRVDPAHSDRLTAGTSAEEHSDRSQPRQTVCSEQHVAPDADRITDRFGRKTAHDPSETATTDGVATSLTGLASALLCGL